MTDSPDIFKAAILIVDDQEADVSLLSQMLHEAGYDSVTTTRNSREVRELHRKNRYDLILLDLQMPDMDGFQVMEELKKVETGGYLPILVITARRDRKLRALKAGAKDFISKPFDRIEVLLRVHNLLESRLLHLTLSLHNLARLENSHRIAGLGDWEHDHGGLNLFWSEGIYRILGINSRDVPPNSMTFYDRVHPDDLAFVLREKKAAADGLRRGDFEHRIIRHDGEVRHIHQIIEVAYDDHGRPVRHSGTLQDITERKRSDGALVESEERFKFVARAMSDGVWDWDISKNTLWWNDGFLTSFGFGPGEIEPGIDARRALLHPEDHDLVTASLKNAVEGDAESWSAEYRSRRKDGSYAFVQDRGFILRDAAGAAIRVVGGTRDLTEQKKVEGHKLRTQRMESIGTLAGGIAHDLNNILTPIMLSIELLKRGVKKDARTEKSLDIIYSCSQRAADLVRQVLSFAGSNESLQISVRLQSLTSDLEGLIRGTFPRNIRVRFELAKDLWSITGDPTQIHQVLLNLAVNARDAMPLGGELCFRAANVTIDDLYADTLHAGIKSGAYVSLEVSDTGLGIPPEILERIFEPFFTTKEVGKGTGIGLATAHAIIQAHGGFINVYSEVGVGSVFHVHLPANPSLLQEGAGHALAMDLPHGKNELVMVVDDEEAIREITRHTLEDNGYRVVTAGDGTEAVSIYSRDPHAISVVLTDMMMPILDGPSTIQALRVINPSVRIIAVSGLRASDNIDKAKIAGISGFLPKPYSAEALLTLLGEIIARPA